MAKKKLNHHLYQDPKSEFWYFQKKAREVAKSYKLSLETTSVTAARTKRNEYLKQIEYHGYIPSMERELPSADNQGKVLGEVALEWSKIAKSKLAITTFESYQKVMNTHIFPYFFNMPIASINGLDIEVFISKLNTVNEHWMPLFVFFRRKNSRGNRVKKEACQP